MFLVQKLRETELHVGEIEQPEFVAFNSREDYIGSRSNDFEAEEDTQSPCNSSYHSCNQDASIDPFTALSEEPPNTSSNYFNQNYSGAGVGKSYFFGEEGSKSELAAAQVHPSSSVLKQPSDHLDIAQPCTESMNVFFEPEKHFVRGRGRGKPQPLPPTPHNIFTPSKQEATTVASGSVAVPPSPVLDSQQKLKAALNKEDGIPKIQMVGDRGRKKKKCPK